MLRVDHLTEATEVISSERLQYIKERNYLIAVWKNIDQICKFTHILLSLIKRIIKALGYLVPVCMAIYKN